MKLIYLIIIFFIIFITFHLYFQYYYSETFDIIKHNTSEHNTSEYNTSEHNIEIKHVWAYWENKDPTKPIPTHIQLCFDTFHKHLTTHNGYNLHILNNQTIHEYLPDLRKDLDKLLLAQKVDYYRIALLYKYGGMWLDADTIVHKNFDDIFNKLKTYDFVSFGFTGEIYDDEIAYKYPSNWALGSQKNGKLMKICLNKLNAKLDEKKSDYDYHDLGKHVIWDSLDELFWYDRNFKQYHYHPRYDTSRNLKNNIWIHTPDHFSDGKHLVLDEHNIIISFLANSEITHHDEYKWIQTATKEEILNYDIFISKLFRKALGHDEKLNI